MIYIALSWNTTSHILLPLPIHGLKARKCPLHSPPYCPCSSVLGDLYCTSKLNTVRWQLQLIKLNMSHKQRYNNKETYNLQFFSCEFFELVYPRKSTAMLRFWSFVVSLPYRSPTPAFMCRSIPFCQYESIWKNVDKLAQQFPVNKHFSRLVTFII